MPGASANGRLANAPIMKHAKKDDTAVTCTKYSRPSEPHGAKTCLVGQRYRDKLAAKILHAFFVNRVVEAAGKVGGQLR